MNNDITIGVKDGKRKEKSSVEAQQQLLLNSVWMRRSGKGNRHRTAPSTLDGLSSMFGEYGSGEDDHANPQLDSTARSGLSLPNTGEACLTGGSSTTGKGFPGKTLQCKQKPLSEDDDKPGEETLDTRCLETRRPLIEGVAFFTAPDGGASQNSHSSPGPEWTGRRPVYHCLCGCSIAKY